MDSSMSSDICFQITKEVLNKSGRKELARTWFDQITDMASVTMEDLAVTGKAFEQYDYKVLDETLRCIQDETDLWREVRRNEDMMAKDGKDLTGRQALRLVYSYYMVDKTSRELYSILHLQKLCVGLFLSATDRCERAKEALSKVCQSSSRYAGQGEQALAHVHMQEKKWDQVTTYLNLQTHYFP